MPTLPSEARTRQDAARQDAARLDADCLTRVEQTLDVAEASLEQLAADAGNRPATPARKTTLDVSIVIPVYNERETVVECVRRVQAVGIHREIILVDDFSLDGTRRLLLKLDREPDIRVLLHGYNRGKGAALRTAFSEVQGEVVIVQDADLEYNPSDFLRLLAPLERGDADVVYGSRFLEGADQDPSRLHRFGNWLLTAASNLTTGQRLTDMETCYKAFRRSVLEQIAVEEERFGFEPEITAKISRLGYDIEEVPIQYDGRTYDEGKKIGYRDALRAFYCIAKYR